MWSSRVLGRIHIPDTELTLRIELKQINPPLAEYERSPRRHSRWIASSECSADFRYRRIQPSQPLQLPSGEYVLDYEDNPDYRIDPRTGTVHAKLRGIPIGEPDRPLRGTYVGAFDFDHHYVWQFFPASLRAERKVGLPYAP
jgi:hypothetical protein